MQHCARYFSLKDPGTGQVICQLCPHHCRLEKLATGLCGVRRNIDGALYTLNYGEITACGLDPVEKKPLYHFYPSRQIYSAGTFGCNFRCGYCQNWQIAQQHPHATYVSPERLVQLAKGSGSIGIAYTYNEPTVWYEYVWDTSVQARAAGLKNVLVTNGFIETKPLRELLPLIDAMNIDVKSISEEYYRRNCGGRFAPVKRAVELAAQSCFLELTTLVVPGENDSVEEMRALASWVASINPEIPYHLSRYFPHYRFNLPPTSLKTMEELRSVAKEKLAHVYLGNVSERPANHTYCPQCQEKVVNRWAYKVQSLRLSQDRCQCCNYRLNIINDATE